jgi:hypothetical protein
MGRAQLLSILLFALVTYSACSLLIGDIPEKSDSGLGVNDGGGGGVGSASGGQTGSDAQVGDGGGAMGGGMLGATTVGGGGSSTTAGGARGSGGAGQTGGSTNSGGMGGRGGTGGGSGTAGTTGTGGSGTGGTTGTAGTTGAAGTTGTGGTGGSGGSCDGDGDQVPSLVCGGADCDDNATLVHPGQLMYFEVPTHVGGTDFDYDCNGTPDPQYSAVQCALLGIGLLCTDTASGFLGASAPACGQSGRFGHCIVSNLMCIEQVEQLSKIMPCR